MILRYRKAIVHQKIGDMEEDTEVYLPYAVEKEDDDDVNHKLKRIYEDEFMEMEDEEDESEEEPMIIGRWGHARLDYIKEHRKILYMNLLTSGKLKSYLADIQRQAKEIIYV